MLNKRGAIIRKADIIDFDETKDHIPNLELIINEFYPEYREYIEQTTNVGLCIAITNNDDIVIINATYNQEIEQFIVYLPFNVGELSTYQRESLLLMLNEMGENTIITSYAKQFDFDSSDKKYTKGELTSILKEGKVRNVKK